MRLSSTTMRASESEGTECSNPRESGSSGFRSTRVQTESEGGPAFRVRDFLTFRAAGRPQDTPEVYDGGRIRGDIIYIFITSILQNFDQFPKWYG
jgi:hypothetical protein